MDLYRKRTQLNICSYFLSTLLASCRSGIEMVSVSLEIRPVVGEKRIFC